MTKRSGASRILGGLLGVAGLAALAVTVTLFRDFVSDDDGIALVGGSVWAIGTVAVLVLALTLLVPVEEGDAEAGRRRDRRRVWAGLVVGMCVFPAAFLTATRGVGSLHLHKAGCLDHLRQMSTILAERSRSDGWPDHGGKAFVLSLVADGVVDEDEPENLEVFFCPACGMPQFERRMLDAYEGLTPATLDQTYLHALTAYAGRRNDEAAYRLGPEGEDAADEPVLACLCHPRVALVAFADGSARVLEKEELGLGPDDRVVVGEASKSPILKKLSFD